MGDFFTQPANPEVPPPPGSDSFDVPPPDFRTIGQQFGAGLKDVGAIGSVLKDIGNTALKIVAAIVGALLSLMLCIVAFLIGLINRMYEGAEPGVDAIATRSLEHVFGIAAGGSNPRKLARGTDTEGAARALGKSITDAIGDGAKASAGSGLQPGADASQAFLGKLARIGIEGWTEGMITEALTVGQFKAVMELTPIMAEILGLGRLSRRVLAPPLKILLEDPYTWFLNEKYRPTLLAHDQATRQFLRGRMSRTDLDRELGRQGFSASAIEALININSKFLSAGEVNYLVSRGSWSQQTGEQHIRDQGYSPEMASTLLALENRKLTDTIYTTIADNIGAAYVRGEIDQARFHSLLGSIGLPQFQITTLELRFQTERELNVKHLTLGEVERMIKAHIMNIDDLRIWMTRENYPIEEQTFLELLLLGEIVSADDAAHKRKAAADQRVIDKAARLKAQQDAKVAAAAKLLTKGVSIATFEKLVENGQRTFDEFRAFLTQHGFQAPAIADLVDLLHATIQQKTDAAAAHQALVDESDTKHIPLKQTEDAVLAGVLTIADLQRFMTSSEYAAGDITIASDFIQAELDRRAAKAKAKADAAAAAQEKDISLPALERAARLGLTTPEAYGAALDAAGFDLQSRDLMMGILTDQISSDQAARQKRADAAARAKKKQISLPELERAIVDGLRPMADYRSTLVNLGFDATDVETLTELLQLRVDHAKDVVAKKAAADAKLKTKDLSLAQLERAVKLGVVGIDTYNAELAAVGFTAEDQAILSTSLLAEISALKQAQARRNTISSALAKKGLNLVQQENLVKDGIVPLDAYTGFLLAHGYSVTDAANLTSLLSLRIEQAKAAAQKRAIAEQRAADKEINLGKEEQAVIDGLRSMDDYRALLSDLGFDELDQATLSDLLASKVAAARSKAAAAAATPPPGPAPSTGRRKRKTPATPTPLPVP